MEKKDTQAAAYTMCCNNPLDKDYTHEKIKELLQSIPKVDYWCLCDEIGEQGTPHTHIYFHAKQGIRHSTLRNKFPKIDIQVSQGTAQQNRDYIRKEGAYIDSEKKETNLIDTFEEWGTLPVSKQGRRTDLELLYELVKDGKTDAEILEICPETAIKHIDKIGRLRQAYLVDKYSNITRANLKVNFIFGTTGTGKTSGVLAECRKNNWSYFRVTTYDHPYDAYTNQFAIIYDEFYGQIPLSSMLDALDIHATELSARYHSRTACYEIAFIISNVCFEDIYPEVQKDPNQAEKYAAWVRRFTGYVKEYTKDGVITYPTMQDYLHRHFKPLPPDMPTPFDEPEPTQETLSLNDDAMDADMPFNQ